ncbi:type VI immunity family protein [Streptomyces sp. NPDC052236]|uniref:type VI immunity family protein n=1 Tax=Streptomyces sp. NPDC052236 TaxID=3365686 RepID=UPI0037D94284
MESIFRVSVYTPQDISNLHTTETLWQLLNDPLVAPRRFDSVERAKVEFKPQNFDAACDIYSAEGVLLVRGSNDKFKAMFSHLSDRLAKWTFWWDLKAMKNHRRVQWLQWLYGLCRQLPPYYGFACSVDEYDAKHTVVEAHEEGTATRTVGVSAADFQRFLPGVYWLTIFGADLVNHFGSKLQSLPNTHAINISSTQTAVLLDSPVVPEEMSDRLHTEAKLRSLLGAKYFFDRANVDGEYELVPGLARALGGASA